MRRITRQQRIRVVAGGYAALGAVGAAVPGRVPEVFRGSAPTAASRTEIRAVYSGISFAFAGALLAAGRGSRGRGAVDAVAAATAGMAAARVGGAALERRLDPWPTGVFIAIEAAAAAALLWPDR
ncbi:DUF4345 family protein [Solicola gregarius]|uniref:DUF4345 family protein n=1 Tax=Solicola gregarius TaxID=2908642 RepID=A0AA46YL52_9ACTN|nr:DUF4345 family protein [Solicola gregarius]UYM06207.1 DUF4345 family protein [Solicola gregarius]